MPALPSAVCPCVLRARARALHSVRLHLVPWWILTFVALSKIVVVVSHDYQNSRSRLARNAVAGICWSRAIRARGLHRLACQTACERAPKRQPFIASTVFTDHRPGAVRSTGVVSKNRAAKNRHVRRSSASFSACCASTSSRMLAPARMLRPLGDGVPSGSRCVPLV